MKTETVFMQTTFCEIQGPEVLELLDTSSDCTVYKVHGFKDPQLIIKDFRNGVNQQLTRCIETQNFSYFAYTFSTPAQAQLDRMSSGELHLSLYDTAVKIPPYMMWIVVGWEEEYPVYPYVFQVVQQNNDDKLVGITIYELEPALMASFIEDTSSNKAT